MMNYDFCFCAVAVAGFMLRSLSFVKNILFKLMKQPVLISSAARTAAANRFRARDRARYILILKTWA